MADQLKKSVNGEIILFRFGSDEKTCSFAQELTSHSLGLLHDEIQVVTNF